MPEAKRVLITGVTGQDGSYLAESLLRDGNEVYGLIRRQSNPDYGHIRHVLSQIRILEGDLSDQTSLVDAVKTARPDQVYNLAAQTHVGTSYNQPAHTMDVTGTGLIRLLEAVRRYAPRARVYQASTSELYGSCRASPHAIPEHSQCRYDPVSPYAIAKLAAYHAVRTYRDAYGLWAVNGVLFNHESPRRGLDFVTRKITWHVARRKQGYPVRLRLGPTHTIRDWGYAPEYVDAMRATLAMDEPSDWVIGTGQANTVQGFLDYALDAARLDGDGWIETKTAENTRPIETAPLVADPATAWKTLKWRAKTRARELARLMVAADLKVAAETEAVT